MASRRTVACTPETLHLSASSDSAAPVTSGTSVLGTGFEARACGCQKWPPIRSQVRLAVIAHVEIGGDQKRSRLRFFRLGDVRYLRTLQVASPRVQPVAADAGLPGISAVPPGPTAAISGDASAYWRLRTHIDPP
ncbi:hypothetical protein PaG_01464 [Moesziomyces aphidis]|uniref:Uncharacterized protein n=1 Tax=Moesziomyces aphidis TaxID=84754 RepID=W3VRS1_MOEAP|nr:hypothetical protein PaG_01464 [Moesziomyces aphidis]